ncbi:hypothetical protein RN001_006408 [Aquatica leii]|uniref:DDE Tnp4 domain-containing protein n=1 Tax=Aquatica leii TaxID=1421715 RepID=A0AAN7PDM8_9COLE|nr:hypothetical protein RN001_006408 [Aquatica leii]
MCESFLLKCARVNSLIITCNSYVFCCHVILFLTCKNISNCINCKLGLVNLYKENEGFNHFCGMIDGLAFLPPRDVRREMLHLREVAPAEAEDLLNYFDATYAFRLLFPSSFDSSLFQASGLIEPFQLIFKSIDINGVKVPFMTMGDPAYLLLPWLLKGYTKSSKLTPEEESLNVYLNSGRVSVEIAFGRLKARRRCLLKRLDIHFTFVPEIVSACCILHNIVESTKDTYTEVIFSQPEKHSNRKRENFSGHAIRDAIKNFHKCNFPIKKTFYR